MMLVFSKKYSYRRFVLLLAAFLLSTFLIIGCSSGGGDSGNDVPLLPPNNLALTAKSGSLQVIYTRVEGIGAEGQQSNPSYEVGISRNEDGSNMFVFDEEVAASNSWFQAFAIVKDNSTGGQGKIFEYPALEDGVRYWIFVRSNFPQYGYSDYAKLEAVPIPMPQPVTGIKVEKGDGRLIVTWDAKPYEEYALNTDEEKGVVGATSCPFNYNQLIRRQDDNPLRNWWGSAFSTIEDNYVFTFDDNDETYKICIFSRNINGDGKWTILGEIDDVGKTISYILQQGVAAISAPDAPVVTVDKNTNKRVELSFTPVLTGDKSVAEYGYMVRESTSANWPLDWTPILISSLTDDGKVLFIISNLENGKTYDIKVGARNTTGETESAVVQGKPEYIPLNPNNPDEFLTKANTEYIYAEYVPHSDFLRIGEDEDEGGGEYDRLIRGEETALGNLYADAIQWYAEENGHNTDFAWLIGDIADTGIQANQTITKRFLQGITNIDYLDDTIVIVTLKGSEIISQQDYNLDLNNYPALEGDGIGETFATTLLGQAAATYRTAHYGGGGTYNGAYWGLPSSELRYTVEYLPYTLDAFNAHFDSIPACVAARDEGGGEYDIVGDPYGCYLLAYDVLNQVGEGDDAHYTPNYKQGYTRGKIKNASASISGAAIDPNKDYKIATSKRIADVQYVAFLKGTYVDTGVNIIDAISEYLYNNGSAGMDPYLDGRVKIEGGVPGDPTNDYGYVPPVD